MNVLLFEKLIMSFFFWKFIFELWVSFSVLNLSFKQKCIHHTIIPSWIYQIPSELWSQARMGLHSTVMGDHTGIVGVVCFFFYLRDRCTRIIKSLASNYIHHTIIPSWIYRIPSELRSQARMGLPSTMMGDHMGIVGVVCFFFKLWDLPAKIPLQDITSLSTTSVDSSVVRIPAFQAGGPGSIPGRRIFCVVFGHFYF